MPESGVTAGASVLLKAVDCPVVAVAGAAGWTWRGEGVAPQGGPACSCRSRRKYCQ